MSEPPTENGPPDETKVELVLRLFRLLKVAGIHQWNNQATVPPLEALLEQVQELGEGSRPISLQVYDDTVFFDWVRIRFPPKTFPIVHEFYEMLHGRGVGGMTIEPTVEADDVRGLVDALVSVDPRREDAYEAVAEGLATAGVTAITVNTPRVLRRYEAKASRVDTRTYVILTYAKASAVLRRYVDSLDDPEALEAASVQAQRVVQTWST